MKILIAEDDYVSRRLLERTLQNWSYEVVTTENGASAWSVLQRPDSPVIAVLDWMMPELDGLQVCKLVREKRTGPYVYILLLTAKGRKEDIADGLNSGADDYLTKPFDQHELRARMQVGERVVALEQTLAKKIDDLESALAQVRELKGLLPICMYCKKIRDDGNYWQQMESYIHKHTGADFSHGICPDCYERVTREIAASNDI